jgi:hypothetical protein
MKSLTERYLEYYTPLIQEVIQKLELRTIPEIKQMSEPFLPLFGKDYEQSALRIIFIGQNTRWWWDLREFIEAETTSPGSKLRERLDQFRTRPFTQGGKTRNTFWGFAMMTIAALHGRNEWQLMKTGAMVEILNSKLAKLLIDYKLAPQFPQFLSGQAEAQGVMEFLYHNAPSQDGCDNGGNYYYAMELVEGESLAALIRRSGLVGTNGKRGVVSIAFLQFTKDDLAFDHGAFIGFCDRQVISQC